MDHGCLSYWTHRSSVPNLGGMATCAANSEHGKPLSSVHSDRDHIGDGEVDCATASRSSAAKTPTPSDGLHVGVETLKIFSCIMRAKGTAMVAHIQYGIGNATGLTATGHQGMRSTRVGAAGTQPVVVASPPNHDATQHHAEQLGFLESARMDREMAREMPRGSQRRQKSGLSIISALMNMSNRRFLILGAGIVLLVGGLLALRFPVFLPDFDQWGFQINCGSGFRVALTQAGIADSAGGHFVDQCHTAIAMRRAWAIPLALTGALLLGALAVIPPSTPQAAGVSVPTDGADGAEASNGAITPASDAPDAQTALARNAIKHHSASAA